MNRTIVTLFVCACAAFAQYSAVPGTAYPALETVLNGKPNVQTGSGAPSGNCTQGKDVWVDSVAGLIYFCPVTNNWKLIGPVSADLPLVYNSATGKMTCPTCSAGVGVTSLNGLNGTNQTFSNANDTNLGLAISSTGTVHTFTVSWIGTLAKARQHAATVYSDVPGAYLDPNWLTLTWGGGQISGIPSTFAPSAHATNHKHGGTDEIASATAGANLIPKAGAGGTLASSWIPILNQNTSGNAGTASAADHTPTTCGVGEAPRGVDANWNAVNCQAVSGGTISGLSADRVPKATGPTTLGDGPISVDPGTGQVTADGSINGAAKTITFSSTAPVDLANGNRFEITLTGDWTPSAVSHAKPGQKFSVVMKQDGTGGRRVDWGSFASNTCGLRPGTGVTTTQEFEVAVDGTIKGKDCPSEDPGLLFEGQAGSTCGAGTVDAGRFCGAIDTVAGNLNMRNHADEIFALVKSESARTANQFVTHCTANGVCQKAAIATADVPGVNGVTYPASPSTHTAPVVTAAGVVTYKALPNCPDTGGNHYNYDTSTDTWSCGTSSSGGGGGTPYIIAGSWGSLDNATGLTAGTTVAGCSTAQHSGTIVSWVAHVAPSGATATFKLWKNSSSTTDPTVANSINTSGIGISSNTRVTSSTLTDFTTTTVTAGDNVCVNLSAVSGTPVFASLQVMYQ